MRTRLCFVLVMVLASSFVVVGCGGGDDDEGNAQPAAAQPAASPPPASPPPADVPEAIQQAVASCKQSVQAAATLAEDVKADLEALCEKAASGDEKAVREASRDVCRKIVEANVPEGASRDQALASCDAAVQSP